MGKNDKPKPIAPIVGTAEVKPGSMPLKDPNEPEVPNSPVGEEKDSADEWTEADEWDQAEAKARAAEVLAKEEPKGLLDKAKDALKHALHIDEPGHMSHATPPVEDPKLKKEIQEAHKVVLDVDIEGLPINKVPGKLRKFIS